MKILLLHASAGAGHRRAAEALAAAFHHHVPGVETVVSDILEFTPPLFRRTYAKGYLDVVRRAPELWGYMYAQSDKNAQVPWRQHVRAIFNAISTHKFNKFFRNVRADAAVCTHFMPLELLSSKTGRHRNSVPVFGIVTDFAVHTLWIVKHVSCYYVATEEARRQLLRKGFPDNRILVTGIPVDPVFSSKETPSTARRRLDLDPGLATVLLMSGGFGVGPTVELVKSLRELKRPFQLLVVAGANEKMRREATTAATALRANCRVYGFVNNMHELVDAADVVVSKPGGLTASEVMAKGCPMIIIDPIPGQEQRNCEMLLEAGAAMRLFDTADLPYKLETLLGDPARLARLKDNARSIGRPHAARDIVRDIVCNLER